LSFASRRLAAIASAALLLAVVGGLLLAEQAQAPGVVSTGTGTGAIANSGTPSSVVATSTGTVVPVTTPSAGPVTPADIVVYGGTASAVMAAVSAARMGASVIIVDPTNVLGGMASSGISLTDVYHRNLVRGLPGELFARIVLAYGDDPSGLAAQWRFEPHVVEEVVRSMAAEAHVAVIYGQPLKEPDGVQVENGRIVAIVTEGGETIRGRVFIDASYEGDLLAQAGVSYTWGRESQATYGEPLAGIGPLPPTGFTGMSALASDGSVLPGVSPEAHGTPGDGDRNVQPSVYRLCFSSDPTNQTPFTAPAGYDPAAYELARRRIDYLTRLDGTAPGLNQVLVLSPIPNRKVDVNSMGSFGTDAIGLGVGYVEGSYALRAQLTAGIRKYDQGLVYFLSHDPSVPALIRNELGRWGLCKDEYAGTDGWPPLLYIREARRLVGQYVLTQADLQSDATKADSIGLGQYKIDSHSIRRLVTSDGILYSEGSLSSAVTPYQIPFRSLLPEPGIVSNLIVTVDVSASHVAWASIRMEPQLMIMGQAGGTAAAMALSLNGDVSAVNVPRLQGLLSSSGAVLHV
jgi:hypothetical protein